MTRVVVLCIVLSATNAGIYLIRTKDASIAKAHHRIGRRQASDRKMRPGKGLGCTVTT